MGANDPRVWSTADWRPLLYAIGAKQCTPFLGAGACAGVLRLGGEIARDWAKEVGYPFLDSSNLPKVAQYRAVHEGSLVPKLVLQREFGKRGTPDFDDQDEPHRVITDLRLPIYITTNYDQFLLRAIEAANVREPGAQRKPRSVICQWHLGGVARRSSAADAAPAEPTPEAPLIFHLHGRIDKQETMVLTEDDYLDFLMYSSEDDSLIPPAVQGAFATSCLLFLGYSLEDMNFKVIFRKLATYMRRAEGARHVSVQLAPAPDADGKTTAEAVEEQRRYLEEHFKLQHVKIYWGTCREFAKELRKQWAAFNA